MEQARLFAPDLAAENERAVELVAVLLEILGVALVDVAQGIAHDARGAEHVGGAEFGRGLRGILGRLVKQIDHRLVIARLPADSSTSARSCSRWNVAILRNVLT